MKQRLNELRKPYGNHKCDMEFGLTRQIFNSSIAGLFRLHDKAIMKFMFYMEQPAYEEAAGMLSGNILQEIAKLWGTSGDLGPEAGDDQVVMVTALLEVTRHDLLGMTYAGVGVCQTLGGI